MGRRPDDATVSVVIPTRDRARLLPDSVASVMAQDHEACEVVIVDDGSTDSTGDLIRSLQAQHGAERLRAATQATAGFEPPFWLPCRLAPGRCWRR